MVLRPSQQFWRTTISKCQSQPVHSGLPGGGCGDIGGHGDGGGRDHGGGRGDGGGRGGGGDGGGVGAGGLKQGVQEEEFFLNLNGGRHISGQRQLSQY